MWIGLSKPVLSTHMDQPTQADTFTYEPEGSTLSVAIFMHGKWDQLKDKISDRVS